MAEVAFMQNLFKALKVRLAAAAPFNALCTGGVFLATTGKAKPIRPYLIFMPLQETPIQKTNKSKTYQVEFIGSIVSNTFEQGQDILESCMTYIQNAPLDFSALSAVRFCMEDLEIDKIEYVFDVELDEWETNVYYSAKMGQNRTPSPS